MPITDHEIMMKEGTILVTETDTKGIITKANEAFVEISGFSESELVGTNHNIVRHPDMPPEAFADLWKTVKSGNPWVGLVKNRTKNGDYYWVEANVTPIYKNGRIDRIMSCRYQPSREQIREAETLYEKIRKKEASLEPKSILNKLNVIKKLSIGQKMTGLGVVMLLPALILLAMLYQEKYVSIDFADKEIVGSKYLEPLKQVLLNTIEHRAESNKGILDSRQDSSKLSGLKREINTSFDAVNSMDSLLGQALQSTASLDAIKQQWQMLEVSNDADAQQNFEQHNVLVGKILELFIQVGDSSNLILDPDLDSYYLMDMQVMKLPELLDTIGQLKDYSFAVAHSNGMDQDQQTQLAVLMGKVSSLLTGVEHDIDTVIEQNASMEVVLAEKKQSVSADVKRFMKSVKNLINGDQYVTGEMLFDQGTAAIKQVSSLYNVTAPNLQMLLEARIDGFKKSLYTSLVSITILILVVSFIAYLLIRYIKQKLNIISNTFYRLTDGHFRNKLDLKGNDELGAMLRSLQGMQVKMNVELAEARQQAIDGARIQQALDRVESCVMVANKNLEIIYMNETVLEMFKNAEEEIKKQLPNFKADELLGSNIDVFHKNPAHQRGMLEKLNTTFRSTLNIGGRDFDIVANPVNTENGDRVGIVVEWRDRTHEVKIENEIGAIVEAVKSGELSQRIELADKEGFFEKMSVGINELTDVIENVFSDVSSSMQAMSQGDLSNKIERDYQGVYLDCKNSINGSIDKINEIVGQITESADFINTSSQEIASGNNNLSQRAEQQASSLEETASSMEELTSTVKNNADNAQQANQVASTAKQLAEQGGTVVKSAVQAMQEINQSSNKIAEIIGVIDEIAFQTNLLALNASVEAARAGEHGRGFSVVATEVRNLAQRSATAARESKDLIQNSVQKVRTGTEFVNETGQSLNEIVTGVKKVGDIVAEIAAASVEQSQGIEQVNQAVSQMDEITQQNAALAEQASAASVSMSSQAKTMNQLLAFFQTTEIAGSASLSPKMSTVSAEPPVSSASSVSSPEAFSPNQSVEMKDSFSSQQVQTAPSPSTGSDDEWEEF